MILIEIILFRAVIGKIYAHSTKKTDRTIA
jgi:hypothetical protein